VKKKSVVYTIGYRNRYNKENCWVKKQRMSVLGGGCDWT
jgi:hypothetical protein